ncbi:MAG: PadR family transcriptional regulator [Cellulosilyticaceae bacterium]
MAFQLGGSLLEACVLAVLNREDAYGYRLTQEVREVIELSESTLYPVLRRLQKNEYLETYDEPFQGRNRRYYRITAKGRNQFSTYLEEWEVYKQKLDGVFERREACE